MTRVYETVSHLMALAESHERGERIVIGNLLFKILRADNRRVEFHIVEQVERR